MAEDMGAMVHADGIKFYEDTANGTNHVGFQSAATLGGDQVWTLPNADGTDGQVLKTDGSGALAWVNNSGVAGAIDDLTDAKSGGTDFTDSMILGHQTTGTLSSAIRNTAVGYQAGLAVTTGTGNTMMGYHAGKTIEGGFQEQRAGVRGSRDSLLAEVTEGVPGTARWRWGSRDSLLERGPEGQKGVK